MRPPDRPPDAQGPPGGGGQDSAAFPSAEPECTPPEDLWKDRGREAVRRLADECGWPKVQLSAAEWVLAGEERWDVFLSGAGDEALRSAREALAPSAGSDGPSNVRNLFGSIAPTGSVTSNVVRLHAPAAAATASMPEPYIAPLDTGGSGASGGPPTDGNNAYALAEDGPDMLQEALAYAREGWPVVPCHSVRNGRCSCGKSNCGSPGKHPRTKNGLKDATTDPGKIRAWWTRWPDANIGLRLGDGIFVADVDGPEGEAFLAEHGLPETLTARTGLDGDFRGRHLYLYAPEGVVIRNRARIAPGLDVKGDDGLVIAPPSLHGSGVRYAWVDPNRKIADAPAWLVEMVTERPRQERPAVPPRAFTGEIKPYARAALEEELEKIRGATPGTRNQTLNDAVFALGTLVHGGELLESLVREEAWAAAASLGFDESFTESDVRDTIESALRGSARSPREVPEPRAAAPRRCARCGEELWGCVCGTCDVPPEEVLEVLDEEVLEALEPSRAMGALGHGSAPAGTGSAPESKPTWQDRFDFPAPPHEDAFYGLPGDVVRLLGPHTEAGEAAILGQFVAAFGNAVGRKVYVQVGGDQHRPNLYVGVVGPSGKGRKGSGLSVALLPIDGAEPTWTAHCKAYGLSTGEGIVHHLRDPRSNAKGELVDKGARDKRLLAVETEFSRVLRSAARDHSILGQVLRQGWDGQTLQTMSKTAPEQATGAHLSLVAHTTVADLRRYLEDVDVLNGFANRFVWLASQRARRLPGGGSITPELVGDLVGRVRGALEAAWETERMHRDAVAEKLWAEGVYDELTADRAGAFGAVTDRADPQVVRLSMIYALADGSRIITEAHLRAALALWEYAERSALWIFGASTGDRLADVILAELRAAYPRPLPRDEIRRLLRGNHPVDEPLRVLEEQDLAAPAVVATGRPGRPPQVWRANPHPPAPGISTFLSTSQHARG